MLSILISHPFMMIYITVSFFLTVLFYIAPDFVSSYLVMQGNLNPGTFIGTMVHKNYGHFFGNLLILVPVWIYSDNVLGIGITVILVVMNMMITGLFVLCFDGCCCGASGINHMLLGIMAIMGNWGLFIFSGFIIISEFKVIGSNDNTAHGVHISWQIAGTLMAVFYCVFKGLVIGGR